MTLGHLKPGVTPAQAVADLNSIGAYLEKTLSQRRWPDDLHLGASGSLRRLSGRSGAGIPCGIDAAGGTNSAGRVRQPGQPVCGTRRRPFPGSCSATRAGIEPHAHSAAALYRSRADFAGRRRRRIMGQRGAVARVERVAAISANFPLHVPVNPDANVYVVALLLALVSGFLFGAVPVRQVLRTNPYEVVKSGSIGQSWAADHCSRCVAGRANCDLRRAGHFFDGGGAWTGALAAQQFRF